jgi:serine/threonine protein kinase
MAGQLSNQTLDHYHLGALVASHSVAEVYQAQDIKLDKAVALHVIHPHLVGLGEWPVWGQRAAQESARLEHPGLLAILDYGQAQGHIYLVTDTLPRTTLNEARPKLTLTDAVKLVHQLCGIFEHLHQQDIFLRDVRPSTIGIKRARAADGLPYQTMLTDLGLIPLAQAGLPTYLPLLEQIADWPERLAYLAPEHLFRQPVDARNDVYALGVLLHLLAVGRLPVEFKSLDQAVLFHTKEALPEPGQFKPNLPADIEAILKRALARREERFATVTDLREALDLFITPTLSPLPAKPIAGAAPLPPTPLPSFGLLWLQAPGESLKAVAIPPTGLLRVGRNQDNDLVLDSSKISRYHVDIRFDGNQYYVTDKRSKNKTLLARQELPPEQETPWPPDQVVTLGKSGYSLQLNQEVQVQRASSPEPKKEPSLLALVIESDQLEQGEGGQKQLKIWPGQRKNLSIKLTNSSSEPMQLNLAVDGIEWTWREPLPPVISLPANRIQRVTLTITPPKGPQTEPKEYPLTIRATLKDKRQDKPDITAEDYCTLKVEKDYEYESWLDTDLVAPGLLFAPDVTAMLGIANQGNIDQTFVISFDKQSGLKRLAKNEIKVEKGKVEKVEIKPARAPIGLQATNKITIKVKSRDKEKGEGKDEGETHSLRTANPRILLWGLIGLIIASMLCGVGNIIYYNVVNSPAAPTAEITAVAVPPPSTEPDTPTPDAAGTAAANQTAIAEARRALATAQAGAVSQAQQAMIATLEAEVKEAAGAATAQAGTAVAQQATSAAQPTPTPTLTPTATLPPTKLTFGLQPPLSVAKGVPLATDITVNIQDQNGNRVSGATNEVLLELVSPANNQTTILTSRTAATGVATFTNLIINAEPQNNYQLRATSAGLTEAKSNLFNVILSPPVASSLVFTVPPTDTQKYQPIIAVIEIRDQYGKRLSGANNLVNLDIIDPDTFQEIPIDVKNAQDGVVSFTSATDNDNLTPKANYRLKAFLAGTNISVASDNQFKITPPPPKFLEFQQQPPSNVNVGEPFTVTVAILDEKKKVIQTEGRTVDISLRFNGDNSSYFSLSGQTSRQAVQGVATFDNLQINKNYYGEATPSLMTVGSYTLVAQIELENGGLLEQPSNGFAINTPPYVYAGSDQNGRLGQTIYLTGTVFDDELPNPPGRVTIGWSQVSGPGTTTFSPNNSATTTATFSARGSYELKLEADDGALRGNDTAVVNIVNQPPIAQNACYKADVNIENDIYKVSLDVSVEDGIVRRYTEDLDGDILKVSSTALPQGVSLSEQGSFSYYASYDSNLPDEVSFNYMAYDGYDDSDSATVKIKIASFCPVQVPSEGG